jgi:hypothetical protein
MPTESPETPCQLCGRGCTRDHLTKHHAVPRAKGGTADDVELICGQCHTMVHATFTNHTLATVYPTVADLRAAPELAGFIKWVRKQPTTRRTRNAPRRKKV